MVAAAPASIADLAACSVALSFVTSGITSAGNPPMPLAVITSVTIVINVSNCVASVAVALAFDVSCTSTLPAVGVTLTPCTTSPITVLICVYEFTVLACCATGSCATAPSK